MSHPILDLRIRAAILPGLRSHARKLGVLCGLDALQQTRFSTAVSEIARNAVQYAGGGVVSFVVEDGEIAGDQALVALVADQGPGIVDLAAVLSGTADANGRIPMGIAGSSRLVDKLTVEAPASGGTVVRLEMVLPRTAPRLTQAHLAEIATQLAQGMTQSPLDELEQQNRELLKTHRDLREKQAELERADERKNQFVATLAHELRNPLGTLLMTLELMRLRPGMDDGELARRRDLMERQARQMSQLVEELMEVAQVTQGKAVLEKAAIDLNVLVMQSVEMTGAATAAKSQVVALQLGATPLWVSADSRRMKQVFCNLIQNSARYTPAQGAITLTVTQRGDKAVVEVRDDGQGIAPELLPHIFGLFVQGDRAHPAAVEGGLGVGLALVRRLVQDHRGAVEAQSAGPGQGSVFTVTLPLINAPAG